METRNLGRGSENTVTSVWRTVGKETGYPGWVEKVERMLGKGAGAGVEKCLEGQAKAFGFGALTVVTGLHAAGLQSMMDEQMG